MLPWILALIVLVFLLGLVCYKILEPLIDDLCKKIKNPENNNHYNDH
mgnify:CR=1 FL=1